MGKDYQWVAPDGDVDARERFWSGVMRMGQDMERSRKGKDLKKKGHAKKQGPRQQQSRAAKQGKHRERL